MIDFPHWPSSYEPPYPTPGLSRQSMLALVHLLLGEGITGAYAIEASQYLNKPDNCEDC